MNCELWSHHRSFVQLAVGWEFVIWLLKKVLIQKHDVCWEKVTFRLDINGQFYKMQNEEIFQRFDT